MNVQTETMMTDADRKRIYKFLGSWDGRRPLRYVPLEGDVGEECSDEELASQAVHKLGERCDVSYVPDSPRDKWLCLIDFQTAMHSADTFGESVLGAVLTFLDQQEEK